ncbi:MAG: YceI family protein, partial [Calditrichia bacterium]
MHKCIPVAVLLFVVFSISLFAQGSDTKVEYSQKGAKRFVVDKVHTNIGFLVRHMVLSKVRGEFKDYTIALNWDENNPENSSVEVRIKVASINTDNQRRDSHLKSSDFFDAKNYPEMIFNSSKIEKVDDNEYVAHGTLTIRGVTKE